MVEVITTVNQFKDNNGVTEFEFCFASIINLRRIRAKERMTKMM